MENRLEINVKTHQLSAPANVKEYAQSKFRRLERFHPNLRGVEVTFKENGMQMECDVRMLMDHKGTQIVCSTAGDLNSAIDMALDRCERQLVRLKEKMRTHKSSSERRHAGEEAGEAPDGDDEEEA